MGAATRMICMRPAAAKRLLVLRRCQARGQMTRQGSSCATTLQLPPTRARASARRSLRNQRPDCSLCPCAAVQM